MRTIAPLALVPLAALSIAAIFASNVASAQTVDVAARVVRHAGGTTPITLLPDEMPAASETQVTSVALGEGKSVTHVRVPSKSRTGIAWEALIAEPNVIFAGLTGYARGVDGERTGEAVQISAGANGASHVLVGDLREDLRICGQAETLL